MKSNQKRICIDIRALENSHKDRGIGYFVRNLVSNLLKIDQTNHYTLICHQPNNNPLFSKFHHSATVSFVSGPIEEKKYLHYFVSNQIYLTRFLYKQKFDLFFSPDYAPPFRWPQKTKTALLIYDFIPQIFPSMEKMSKGKQLEGHVRNKTVKRIDRFLTISESSKNDAVKFLGIDPAKIDIIFAAADKGFGPVSETVKSEIKKRYAAGSPYFLYVGEITDPRKNVSFLIESFASLKKNIIDQNYKLVLAGRCQKNNQTYYNIMALIKKNHLEDNVIFTGFVPESDIYSLFASAELSLFPSTYEGFGLPILQSIVSAVPVVGFANSSVKELFHDSALLVPDFDKAAFTKAIEKLLTDQTAYTALQKKGLEKSKEFSWNKTAKLCLESLNRVL